MGRGFTRFADRVEAGRRLAHHLEAMGGEDVVVLGLPRGGVPVAAEVATALGAPLDVIIVRKLGVPVRRELAMGAIGEDGVRVVNDEVVRLAGITPEDLDTAEERERAELLRRAARFRGHRPRVEVAGHTALIVDDGIATGSTARAACQVARAHGASRVVVAVPVAPVDAAERFADAADEFIALETPENFFGVGQFYGDFSQTTDDDVIAILDEARRRHDGSAGRAARELGARDEEVWVTCASATVAGHLTIPEHPTGLVIFAHGSGSSRHSTRNRHVASILNQAGIATLLFDLLTDREAVDRANVFDVELLAHRLGEVTDWLIAEHAPSEVPLGYFGASTGAAAALWAAADPASPVAAVVSRGGRPDLAAERLAAVRAPTRLIVGGDDHAVLELNERAQRELRCPNDLVIVPGATHLFEEPGTLDRAAEAARDWFEQHFG